MTTRAELVVFDFDGTILDTEWPHFTAVRDTFRAFGTDLELERWQHVVGRADHPHWSEWLADEVGHHIDLAAARDDCRQRKDAATLAEPLRPGVPALFDRIAAAGVPIAVASSSPRSWVEPHLERLGLRSFVHTVRTRDDVVQAKPWPDVYLAACAAVGVAPTNAVAIEDSHHGCAAAVRAGMACVVVPNRVTAGQDFAAATLVLDSLHELAPGTLGLP